MVTRMYWWIGAGLLLAACEPMVPAPIVEGQNRKPENAFRPMVEASRMVPQMPEQSPAAVAPAVAYVAPIAPTVIAENLNKPEIKPPVATRAAAPAPQPALAAIAPAAGPAPAAPVYQEYVVQSADTLFKIARTHNAKPDDILQENQLGSAADIRVGQTLRIPVQPRENKSFSEMIGSYLREPSGGQIAAISATPVAEKKPEEQQQTPRYEIARIEPAAGKRTVDEDKIKYIDHKVTAGETIYRISKQYGISVFDVMAANDLDKPENLQAGMDLRIPQNTRLLGDMGGGKKAAEGADARAALGAALPPLGESVSATLAKNNDAAPNPVVANNDKGTDDADSLRPLKPAKPVTEAEKIRAELKRGTVDRALASKEGKIWPVRGTILNTFGERGKGVSHTGLNIAVPENTPVLATEAGTVIYAAGGLRGYGNMVLMKHDNGYVSAYAHNKYLLVRKGERVKKGQVIAMSGMTGNADEPMLHFELRRQAESLDPVRVLGSMN